MIYATFILVMVLSNGAPATVTAQFPGRDMCEAAAAQIKRDIPGSWKHTCVPLTGAATR